VRRFAALAVVAMLAVPACASDERPEGVVERWLASVDQAEAGRPERWTVRPLLTDDFFPEITEPGAFDEIRVGDAQQVGTPKPGYRVPFSGTLVVGGRVIAFWGYAIVREGPDGLRIARFATPPGFPPTGAQDAFTASTRETTPVGAWVIALVVAAALVGVEVLLMRLAGRGPGAATSEA